MRRPTGVRGGGVPARAAQGRGGRPFPLPGLLLRLAAHAPGLGSVLVGLLLALAGWPASAHHILGRPSYTLNEDSNTPPSMVVEAEIGEYSVRYMAFPAFPRPGETGRVNFYASRRDTGEPYQGRVTFTARDDSWLGGESVVLGTQGPDDNVFRQSFVFGRDGRYLVSAEFEDGGVPYRVDLPVQVGDPFPVGPLGFAAGAIAVILVGVSVVQRRRLARDRIRAAREESGAGRGGRTPGSRARPSPGRGPQALP